MTALDHDKGRLALGVYAHLHRKAGDTLDSRNFLAVASRRRIKIPELQSDIDHAVQRGWLEETANGSLRLTDRGFEQIESVG